VIIRKKEGRRTRGGIYTGCSTLTRIWAFRSAVLADKSMILKFFLSRHNHRRNSLGRRERTYSSRVLE
jgi:hypothetical protein